MTRDIDIVVALAPADARRIVALFIGARMFETNRAIVLASLAENGSALKRKQILYERFYGDRSRPNHWSCRQKPPAQ